MSLVGVDIGSSAVKAAAYRDSGRLIARANEAVPSMHPAPGHSEVDGDEVWNAVVRVVRSLTSSPGVRRDPPEGIAVSASGREGFPARADGSALGPCLRTADARRPRTEAASALPRSRERWLRACGHVPDHMDPTNRLLWWQETAPRTMADARWFLGWHELVSLRLTGRPTVDPALASGFLIFDLSTGTWSPERLAGLDLDARLLPDVVPWGTSIGPIRPKLAADMGLPPSCVFVAGSWDSSCAAVGTAVVEEGSALVAAGTWESVVAPLSRPRLRAAAKSRLALTPQPSTPGLGLWARSPNGTSVLDWARGLSGIRLREIEAGLAAAGPDPTSTLVVPHLSGVPAPWPEVRDATGTMYGLTLATSALDLVMAAMEGIAIELTFAIDALREGGSRIDVCRVTGGGSRSSWWMQLKADLLSIPVEVSDQSEPGTLGAALLAGVGLGTYHSLGEAAERVRIARRFEPDDGRGTRYREKVERYRAAVASLMGHDRGT